MTLRIFLLLIITVAVSIGLTAIVIPMMKRWHFQQFQREEGPQSHMVKQGTPSMGGIGIVLALIIGCLVGGLLFRGCLGLDMVVMILTTILFGVVGFTDDYNKAAKKQNEGLSPIQKIIFQVVIAVCFAVYVGYISPAGTTVWIPFADIYVDFGIWYIPFIVFVLLAMTNSVNLTDGMDGLASGVTTFVAVTLAICGMYFMNMPAIVFCLALCAACMGFLFFNKYPAKIFMGDTGSMALGAALTAAAIAMKAELLLPIAGLIYVLEALSVIIQVGVFKKTGKRVFRMAPLHHHFEEGGMKETKVVLMFWLVAIVCCALTLLIVFA
ncbi:MAG: phospho-N-acetylmuramoyl-pentapeptide-transferase [Clostridia bacterium]|nr:phospho-N-acetylmuramoyl-pentapeptide-transferase [Clostridia bacterium]